MSLIIPANTLASGGYEVDNSLRFNRGSSDRLTKTYASSGNRVKWTFSMWVKRSEIASTNRIFGVYQNDSYNTTCYISGGGNLVFIDTYNDAEQAKAVTNMVFRDISAWYHIVVVYDKDNATSADKLILYVNGEIASLSSYTAPTQATTWNVDGLEMEIGAYNSADYFNGYLSEITFIDGTANAVTDFGEFDEDSGIWKPKAVSGLTFGTNGFYLDFESSGSLGADVSGNGNNFTVNNLTAIDQTTDTPTNNFCTLNPLVNASGSTFSEGNLKSATVTGNAALDMSTFGLTQGKWYWEVKATTLSTGASASERNMVGITKTIPTVSGYDGSILALGVGLRGNGNIAGVIGAGASGWNTYVEGNIISVALDLDNGKLYFATNGTYGNSSNPSTASNGYSFTVGTDTYFPAVNVRETAESGTWEVNFGNPTFTISSGNTDGNDRGNFEYAVPSGYLSLCTANISEVLG